MNDFRPAALSLDPLFRPRSVAIIGLSRQALRSPVSILGTLKAFGYRGDVFVVNPNLEGVDGENVFPDLRAISAPIDLAVITVSRSRVPRVLEDCIAKEVRVAIVITQGFADADARGRRLQEEMASLARRHGIRILGPNTLGVANAFAGFTSSFFELHREPAPVGAVYQSGLFMMGHNIVRDEPAGYGMAVDLGNACDIDIVDVLRFYEKEDAIRVIQGHVESVGPGREFLAVVARVSREKPIILLKSGRSAAGQRAAASHSGAIAGENRVWASALRKCGIVEAGSAEELRLLSKAFVTYAPPRGPRVAVMTFSGAAGILAADAIEGAGLVLAELGETTRRELAHLFPDWMAVENPLDVWFAASGNFHDAYPRMLELLLNDEGVDAVICIYPSFTLPEYAAFDGSAHIRRLASRHRDKPILGWTYGLNISGFTQEIESQGNVMVFPSLDAAAITLGKLLRYDRYRRADAPPPPVPHFDVDDEAVERILRRAQRHRTRLLNVEALEILEAYGIAVASWRLVQHPGGLEPAGGGLGFPVCMKVVSSEIAHKSDVGGVILNIGDPGQLIAGHDRLLRAVASLRPAPEVSGVLIQKMVPEGKEVIIGAKRDAVFGHCLLVGAGGIYAELLDDLSFRLAPLSEEDGYEMIAEIRFARILNGVRGEAPGDIRSVVDTLLRVSQLVTMHPEIQELDINPLVVYEDRMVVVDARIVLGLDQASASV